MVDKSKTFKKNAKQLKKAMCWRKYRLYIFGGIICAIIIIAILLIIIIPIAIKFSD